MIVTVPPPPHAIRITTLYNPCASTSSNGALSPSKGSGVTAAPSSQHRACPFPSTRLKPLKRPVRDAVQVWVGRNTLRG